MNMLTNATPNQPVTMTSLQLVEFINSQRKENEAVVRHSDFLAKVPKVLGSEYSEKFRSTYIAENGKQNPCYVFPKREACLMAMSYSYDIQAAVFDKMTLLEQELSQKIIPVALPNFLDPAESAICWAEQYKARQAVEQKLAIAEPKAIALDQIADTTSLFTIRETAKMVKSKERELVNELIRRRWVYRDKNKTLQPYAEKIDRGYVTTVMTAPIKQKSGEEKVFSQLRITAKGVTRLGYLAAKGVAA